MRDNLFGFRRKGYPKCTSRKTIAALRPDNRMMTGAARERRAELLYSQDNHGSFLFLKGVGCKSEKPSLRQGDKNNEASPCLRPDCRCVPQIWSQCISNCWSKPPPIHNSVCGHAVADHFVAAWGEMPTDPWRRRQAAMMLTCWHSDGGGAK